MIAVYDCIRIARILIKHSYVIIGIEDIIFWIIIGFKVFEILYSKNDGILRGYAIMAMAFGMLVYNALISKKMTVILNEAVNKIKNKRKNKRKIRKKDHKSRKNQ